MSEYTCDMCGGTYEKAWTDEEAEEEYISRGYGVDPEKEGASLVCDGCFCAVLKIHEKDPGSEDPGPAP